MTAKEKAKELVFETFQDGLWEDGHVISKPMLKKCALICVNELIKQDPLNDWQEVKQEINKL
jgi:hypothetical protein